MHDKQRVALSSLFAAIFLTGMKLIVGVITGSLGILSEAVHSAMDLGAATLTFFAVKISDKPADHEHNYGHGKVESFSAFVETILLLITCGWIIYEALERLFFGKPMELTGTYWGIIVILISIIVDFSRANALQKAAEKYKSQALEADALHFSSDILGSLVVLTGLICVEIGYYFKLPILKYADPVAALGVSLLVIIISCKLGKKTIEVLLDTAPKGMVQDVLKVVNQVKGVLDVSNVRIRPSGPVFFIDLNLGINRHESHRVVHSIVNDVRERLNGTIPNSDIMISTYPVDSASEEDEIYLIVKKVVDRFPVCTNIHNIHVYKVSNKKYIAIHLEVKTSMTVKASHDLSHEIGDRIRQELKDVREVNVNFEYVNRKLIEATDITKESREVINQIKSLINQVPERLNCHKIRVYEQGEKITLFLHCEINMAYNIEKVEEITKTISKKLRNHIQNIENVHIHLEPIDEGFA